MSGRKQQTAAGLFFSMLLRAAVIILGIAIVAFGAFFVLQAVKGNTEALADTKIVAREDGVGKELVQYFANASYEVGTVTSNVTESTDEYDVVIIIGASDSEH